MSSTERSVDEGARKEKAEAGPSTEGGSIFEPRLKSRAAGKSVKIEVAGGDFSPLVGHPNPNKGRGDIVTEFVPGIGSDAWSKRQQTNQAVLEGRGALVATGVDMTNPEQLRKLAGDMPIGKIKAENIQHAEGDDTSSSTLLRGMFSAADKTLAPLGVVEYGMTGPLQQATDSSRFKMHPAFDAAARMGFEPVEIRSGMTPSHTFSQSVEGMRDLRRHQVVFARRDEAEAVRGYFAEKTGTTPEKQRAVISSGMGPSDIIGVIQSHHDSLRASGGRGSSSGGRGSGSSGGRSSGF